MLKVELFEADGVTPLAPRDFGAVPPGTTSAPVNFVLKNTGTVALSAPVAWIEQGPPEQGEFRVTIGGRAVTGTSAATATTLAALAVEATVTGSATWRLAATAPGVPVATGQLRIRPAAP